MNFRTCSTLCRFNARVAACHWAIALAASGFFVSSASVAQGVDEPDTANAWAATVQRASAENESLVGRVVNADGQPLAGVDVVQYSGRPWLTLKNGKLTRNGGALTTGMKTDADGSFPFDPTDSGSVVVAMSPEGYVEMDEAALMAAQGVVRLRPWAAIEGVLYDGAAPATGGSVMMMSHRPQRAGDPSVFCYDELTCDANGVFRAEHVPAGGISLGRKVALGDGVRVDAFSVQHVMAAGETFRVQIGGSGRPVSGRLAWPDADDDRPLHVGHHWVTDYRDPAAAIALRDELLPDFADWSPEQKQAFFDSDEGITFREEIDRRLGNDEQARVQVRFPVQPDGIFLTEGLRPGTYEMKVLVQPPPDGERIPPGPPIARHEVRFTVPPLPEGEVYVAEPLDLGVLTLMPIPPG